MLQQSCEKNLFEFSITSWILKKRFHNRINRKLHKFLGEIWWKELKLSLETKQTNSLNMWDFISFFISNFSFDDGFCFFKIIHVIFATFYICWISIILNRLNVENVAYMILIFSIKCQPTSFQASFFLLTQIIVIHSKSSFHSITIATRQIRSNVLRIKTFKYFSRLAIGF